MTGVRHIPSDAPSFLPAPIRTRIEAPKRTSGAKSISQTRREPVAVNKPTGDRAQGSVRKRIQRREAARQGRVDQAQQTSGQFMDVKKSSKKFKGVRKEA